MSGTVSCARSWPARYAPGDRLIELNIAKEYGTSQGPVREALRELEMLGFVRSEPHRGTYVRDPWQRGMLELFEVRGALEEFATRLATPDLSEDVSELQAEVDAMSDAAARDDVKGVVEHSERFHRIIIVASGNGSDPHDLERPGHRRPHGADDGRPAPRPATVAESHQPIVDAIASGDAELAGRVSRDHQRFFEEVLAARGARRRRRGGPAVGEGASLASG